MTEKTLGYVELEWSCPSCGARNAGATRTCKNCGAQHSTKIEFEQTVQETLITDEAQIAAAAAGPDIHCGYCGTRNPATAKLCKQCGGDLAEGQARAAGAVLGGLRDAPAPPLICSSCGTENPATARKCSKCGDILMKPRPKPTPEPTAAQPAPSCLPRALLFGLLGLIGLAVIYFVLAGRTTDLVGQVSDVAWKRTVAIEALVPVTREEWRDRIPAGLRIGQCTARVRHTQDQPAPNSREVCGTPYVVDQGSGYGKVVQKCWYEVFDDWCQYQDLQWRSVNLAVAQGNDLNPRWPAFELARDQRAGSAQEEYVVTFTANDKSYNYTVRDEAGFRQLSPGSRWRLQVNTFGAITAIEPAR